MVAWVGVTSGPEIWRGYNAPPPPPMEEEVRGDFPTLVFAIQLIGYHVERHFKPFGALIQPLIDRYNFGSSGGR
jgi:hypothetical protein